MYDLLVSSGFYNEIKARIPSSEIDYIEENITKTIHSIYEYKNSVLVPHQENGNTVYSGKLKGEQATFTVTEDKTVDPETVADQLDDIVGTFYSYTLPAALVPMKMQKGGE